MAPFSTRHSRARGNPGLFGQISLDTRFRGYDGTQAGLFVLIPKLVFSKEDTKSTKFGVLIFPTLRVLRDLRGEENRMNVTHNPHKKAKEPKSSSVEN